MKEDIIGIEDILRDRDQFTIIDVRSPGEFQTGHIPGALSIPLFSNEERARVGTLYTQVSRESAMEEGLAIAGEKMRSLLEAGKKVAQGNLTQIVIHCWRGGNRSKAMSWLYNFSGLPVSRLIGGYKSYRTALHDYFEKTNFNFHILGGCTGAGKTEILESLKKLGAQVIDLERLAHHKGSAFGSIGESVQETTEQFENNLFLEFLSLDVSKPIWLENESKSIGRNQLPDALWHKMRESTLFTIEVDQDIRLNRALSYYAEPVDLEQLKLSFEKIKKRIGGLDFQTAMQALDNHDLRTAASIALKYYDKAYRFQLESWPAGKVVTLDACHDVNDTAGRLYEMTEERNKIYRISEV